MPRSTPQVHSKTRTPTQTALPPCEECEDCDCCCGQIVAYASTDFLGAQRVVMNQAWSEFAFQWQNPFSIAFWMKFDDSVHAPANPVSTIIHRTGYDAGDPQRTGYVVEITSTGQISLSLLSDEYGDNTDPNAYLKTSDTGTNLFLGGWHHVALVYEGTGVASSVKIYIDGTLGTLTTSGNGVTGKNIISTTAGNIRLQMGISRNPAGGYYNAAKLRLGEFAMFDRAITAEDVSHLSGRAYDAVNGCDAPINIDKSVNPWETCPEHAIVWYRMGDDPLDSLGPNPSLRDQLQQARHAQFTGFTTTLFTADSPPICDCDGFGTLHVWEYDNRTAKMAYIPAMMSVESPQPSTWATSATDTTRGDNRIQILNLDNAFTLSPGHADHAPSDWWGSLEFNLNAARNYTGFQYLAQTGKVLVISQLPTSTLTGKTFVPSPPAHAAATTPANFPTVGQITGFGLTATQHPTTSQPGAMLRTVGGQNQYNNLTWWYDAVGNAWTAGPTVPHHQRPGSAFASHGAHQKIYFGEGTTTIIDFYDTATSSWGTQFNTPGPQFRPGSSMMVHPTTGDLYCILLNDTTWEFWHYAVGTQTWTKLANPNTPMIADTQPMHFVPARTGADWLAIVASEDDSRWSVYNSATNTWGTYRVPAPPNQSRRARWFRTSHIATVVPRS